MTRWATVFIRNSVKVWKDHIASVFANIDQLNDWGPPELTCYHQLTSTHVPSPFPFPQMSRLCRRLDQLWEDNQGCEILFAWIQFLKEEALDFLGIQSPLEVVRGGSKAGSEGRKSDPAVTGTVCVLIKACWICICVGASALARCLSITCICNK